MGTSLTGLTPATTYDALIKVGDNGPLSATAKYLSDGLGNDAPMSMSTSRVGINTNNPDANLHISGDASNRAVLRLASTAANRLAAVTFYGNNVESAVMGYEGGSEILSGGVQGDFIIRNVLAGKDIILDTNAGNVGIGTTTPLAKLQTTTAGTAANEVGLRLNNPNGNVAPTGVDIVFQSGYTTGVDGAAIIRGGRNTAGTDSYITFQTNSGSGLAEVGRWLPTGGLTFNGDTAAANALDDYEEGTWTPVLSFGFGDTGLTYNSRSGTYTKIGRKVTLNGYISVSNKGTSTGACRIGAFPFTCANGDSFLSAISMWLNTISFTGQYQGLVRPNTNYSDLGNVSEAGTFATLTDTNFTTNSEIIMCITYFV